MASNRLINDPIALPARAFYADDLITRLNTALPGSNPGRQARVDAAVASSYEFNDARAAGITVAVYDFGNRGSLISGMLLTRATSATYLGSAGLRRTAPIDVPRFALFPDTLARRGLLIEGDGINRVLASQDVSDMAWTRQHMTTPTVNQIVEDSGNFAHGLNQAVQFNAGETVTLSAGVKSLGSGAKRYLYLQLPGPAFTSGLSIGAKFDPDTGVASGLTGGATTASYKDSNGRYICSISGTVGNTLMDNILVRTSDVNTSGGLLYQGDGVSGLDVNDIQLELGGVATSRIVTTDTIGTRAADFLTVDVALYGVAEGNNKPFRYTFDDLSTQDTSQTVAYGLITVPTNLSRRWLRKIESL